MDIKTKEFKKLDKKRSEAWAELKREGKKSTKFDDLINRSSDVLLNVFHHTREDIMAWWEIIRFVADLRLFLCEMEKEQTTRYEALSKMYYELEGKVQEAKKSQESETE